MAIPNLTLNHYTSGHGLLGIVNTDSIWATKIQYMNDSKEFIHSIDLAKEASREYKYHSSNTDHRIFCDALIDRLDRMSGLALYVTCFSEVHDSLSQWRGYCPPSFGYSLGFDADKLKAIAREQGFNLQPCIYDGVLQREVVNQWVKKTLDHIISQWKQQDDLSKFFEQMSGQFLPEFVNFSPYFKNRSFLDEKEWRLVALIPANDPRIQLRPCKSMLAPYAPIKLGISSDNSPLWNVLVGPTPNLRLAMDSISFLYNKMKVNQISHTTIPYRDW